MDIILAKTFLQIVSTGNFVAAAEKLFVTQSTVSARVKTLEEQLGKRLFSRSKAGVRLTPAGNQFQRFAYTLVRVWEEAKLQVAVPEGFKETLIIGAQYSLWSRFMIRWLPAMRNTAPEVAIRAEIGLPQQLMRELLDGVMDIAVMYQPEHRLGLKVDELFDDELVMVTTDPNIPFVDHYVYIDWDESFRAQHQAAFPELAHPGVTLELGALMSLHYLMNNGGAAYLPRRVVQVMLHKAQLFLVPDTPIIPYPVYVVYQSDLSLSVLNPALFLLRETAEKAVEGVLPVPFWAT